MTVDEMGYDEDAVSEDYISRDDFMKLSSVEDIKSKIEEILDDTAADGE
jgi:hypothetical protein|nr:MAG TPA: hypothetical protein [Bacteriophage sp.]